jgi:Zn-dependent protease with chaperone function
VSVAALSTVVTLATLGASYLVARAAMRGMGASSNEGSGPLFARGVGPTVIASGTALGAVLPAFLLFEPPHSGERAGVMLLVLAAVGGLHAARTIGRAIRMLSLSRALTRRWLRTAAPLEDSRWGLPTFAIDAGFPVVAVAGLFRPCLFVDRRVLAACSGPELDAIAAHERAHVMRRDNLRRLLIGACAGPASAVAAAWREAAERGADTHAADSPRRGLDLASALLKMARLAPPRTLEYTAFSTVHDGGSLETRVRYLLHVEPAITEQHTRIPALLVAIPLALMMGLNSTTLLRSVHTLTEAAVRHLP